ncbi:winged helix-turn-helix transcriptional regulator [Propionispora vibrioides]|uniref:DNA-binding transcriptional regulator, HxlR family n=1 Tax=Propionispora vibrioides TaxID=112903 RepID=A0A1H8WAR8_9FIRM|nr:helix-turn-helix domain-containing protein [Propionispora vibrioides]SEP24709.1 DNA-binding transcriptional regulator, HxlR family [Propionispora vibrioides]
MSKKVIDETHNEENLLCPIRYTIDIVGGKWKLPIICMLASGLPIRYSTIKRKLTGVTNMMLAQSLKELEASGIVHREQYNEVPPRVEYTLTEKGKSILPPLVKLAEWGTDHMQEDKTGATFCATCKSMK